MTQDQFMGMLRQLLPITGTLLTFVGVSSVTANSIINFIMSAAGPGFILWGVVWAFVANSRASIMASAAKPVDANTPAPEIILPAKEAALADSLASNVTAKK